VNKIYNATDFQRAVARSRDRQAQSRRVVMSDRDERIAAIMARLDVEAAMAREGLRDIDHGVIGANGEPTGELYQPRKDATHWAGEVIIRHFSDSTPARARAILGRWKKEGLLVEQTFWERPAARIAAAAHHQWKEVLRSGRA